MMMQVSIDELGHFAEQFWNYVEETAVFAVHGTMGAGKTTIISALCRYRGVHSPLSSPTFSIINEYAFGEGEKKRIIFHIDLYRLSGSEEVTQSGVEDCIDSGSLCFVEWPKKAPYLFDERTVHLFIEPLNDTTRMVKIYTAAELNQQSMTEQL